MRILLARALAVLALTTLVAAAAEPATRPPNFVVILADDLGYGDLGCYGSTRQRTPHLDSLAASGVRFTDFHANSSVCTPTRAALLTGRYQQRCGMEALLGLDPAVGLSPKVRTLPGYLRAAGYATAAFGKWHLGLRAPFTPTSHGFDEFIGLHSGDGDHHSRVDRSGGADWWNGDRPYVEKGYTTDLITQHALGFIERNRNRPFFLYVANLAVHFPWQGPQDKADRVVGGNYDGDPKFGSSADKHRSFREMVTALDNSVGRITDRLRELDLEKNTVVVFTSDNGGYSVDRGGYVAVSSNAPWRGQKGELFEGGHRVAGIVSWPGRIAAGRVSHATVMTMDILPTFLELAGVPQPGKEQASDGVSLVPHLLRETALAERTLFWRRSETKVARRGEWKALVQKGEPPRLFNLQHDPAEREDVSDREPARLAGLMKALAGWETDVASSARSLAQSTPVSAGEFIFEAPPHPQCHASTVAESSGGLVAAWFGGTRENAPDVGIWLSLQDGGRWTKPVEVANGVQFTRTDGTIERFPCWNPVLFQPRSGALMLFYKAGPAAAWWGMLMTSADGGRTWSEPRRLPEGILGPIKNKPVELPDGTILCASSTETTTKPSRWQVHFEWTLDVGVSWSATGPINDGIERALIQPSILMHPAGRLQAVGRTKHGRVFETWSDDRGRTWSAPGLLDLPNPNSGTDAVTLTDGRHVIVYNHTGLAADGRKGERSPLNVAVSRDGRKWEPALILESEAGEFSYPSVIQARDGSIHITYTWRRERIRHVTIDPRTLPGGVAMVRSSISE